MAVVDPSIGQIRTAIARIRKMVDEPDLQVKYSDSNILEIMMEFWQEGLPDLYDAADNPPLGRFSFTLTDNEPYYTIPAVVGTIIRVAVRDDRNNVVAEVYPRNEYHPGGPGLRIEGAQRIWIDPYWIAAGQTYEMLYIPSGDIVMHVSSTGSVFGSATALTLNVGASGLGVLDARANAYVGACVSVFNGSAPYPGAYPDYPVQSRIIESHDNSTGSIVVNPGFSPTPNNNDEYEVFPVEAPGLWPVVTRWSARHIALVDSRATKFKVLDRAYQEAKRACQKRWANAQIITPDHMDSQVVDNPDYMWSPWSL